MTITHHQTLLQEIGKSLDVALEFDDKDQCFLLLDEQLMVSVRSLGEAWIFYGMIGNLYHDDHDDDDDEAEQDEEAENIAQTLLSLNLAQAESGAASIAIEKTSGVIMLVLRVATWGMDSVRMKDVLAAFVDQLKTTIAMLNALDEVPEIPAAQPVFPVGMEFFQRV